MTNILSWFTGIMRLNERGIPEKIRAIWFDEFLIRMYTGSKSPVSNTHILDLKHTGMAFALLLSAHAFSVLVLSLEIVVQTL